MLLSRCSDGGAQFYLVCVQLEVTGGGDMEPSDAGIFFNVYLGDESNAAYVPPVGDVYSGLNDLKMQISLVDLNTDNGNCHIPRPPFRAPFLVLIHDSSCEREWMYRMITIWITIYPNSTQVALQDLNSGREKSSNLTSIFMA
ncbi:uncharacterized protein ARMOST_07243 [Armillaria ostoyae]|uniref:Uncharacterized protein n=1 Tax=Armillaria ostoyae TaxID=47428 RepID=A0A284R599_ARMOS|nr:uncharacterized protein ARMOST_07243 [Armillaria ostoyae]